MASPVARKKWTTSEVAILRKQYPHTLSSELARELGRPLHQIYAKAAELDLKKVKGFASRITKAKLATGWRSSGKAWTSAQIEQLKKLYPHKKTELVAVACGHSMSSIYMMAKKQGLTKTQAYLDSSDACRLRRGDNVGAPYRFKKGHVPANKGLRRPGWHAGRMRETQFRKGERRGVAVKLYKPIGTERLSKEGYLERKINDDLPLQRRWRAVHLIEWEKHYGPLPSGYAVKDYRAIENAKGAFSLFDGYANTLALADAGSEFAKWALARDMYIPALDELEQIYRWFKPGTERNSQWMRSGINQHSIPPAPPYTAEVPTQTTFEQFRVGGREAFEQDLYWTSTRCANVSSYAWYQSFNSGVQSSFRMGCELRGCAVRRIKL